MVNEIMGSNLRTREAILLGENEIRTFHGIIEANTQAGWNSFEQCLLRHFQEGAITEETALLYCVNKSVMRKTIDRAKKEIGGHDAKTIGGGPKIRSRAARPAPEAP